MQNWESKKKKKKRKEKKKKSWPSLSNILGLSEKSKQTSFFFLPDLNT